ncbi:hypothetical protein JWG45_11335 [Leptospira sp. 201903070]|uniref:Arginyl tRNA synthetase N-terminal domain-containing protein n=1 Tax=Leptospira ainlahdjerensis TaxID=2810033 RepID=A0ABS2UBF2_9LEPT|nr:hypothetical protein [Leptospira ainlahdjerensis]MBM9577675.1 hypothetical protein [Leptospira ainlahdjerensis]MBM9577745.1 hypothetical protein [Leptospira ainlahdjerensis]
MSKQKLLEFIADLTCPMDPFVFAGFGSNYQEEYLSEENNVFELEDRYIEQFLCSFNLNETISHLFSILITKPVDFYENLATRRSDFWDHSVNLMIAKAAKKNPEAVSSLLLSSIRENPHLQKRFIELLGFLDIEISHPILLEMKSDWKNLDVEEMEILDCIHFEFQNLSAP